MKSILGRNAAAFISLFFLLFIAQGALAGMNDLISMDDCGRFVGGGHCFYNNDYKGLREGSVSFTFDTSFDSEYSTIGDGSTYVVPMFTTMTLSNFSTYINACINGASEGGVHAIDLLVDNVKVADNYSVKGQDNCFGDGQTFKGSQNPVKYLFSEPGLHTVKIIIATQNNGTCGMVVGEFDVIVVHPIIAINGSSSQIVSFTEDESQKTRYLVWTITSVGTSPAILKNVTATGCDSPGLSCSFPGFGPMTINPGEVFLLIEEVRLDIPGSMQPIPVHQLGIDVSYTDLFDASDLRKQPAKPISMSLLWAEEQRFHVELRGGEQNFCIGKDGRLGGTGLGDVPRVMFRWNWSDIGLTTCDREDASDLDFVYCDPTQFSIELLKRLNRINNLANDGNLAGAKSLQNFQAYLIGDSFNEDFRKDFDYYYTESAFFEADWYNSPETPWNLYFTDPNKMSFLPEQISSGLYDVKIEFEFEDEPFSFFYTQDQSTAIAKITVRLTKLRDPYVPNPLYYLPFNGEVGLEARPGETDAKRTGYGLGFAGDEFKIDEFSAGSFVTTKGEGEKTVSTIFEQDFEELNIKNRGVILSIAKDGSFIKFSPSNATPLIMKITASGERADGYYSVRSGGSLLDSSTGYMALWTGFASTMNCSNFDKSALYYRGHDSKASDVPSLLSNPSYGFTWEEIPVENRQGQLFLQSVFYTPLNSDLALGASTADTELIGPRGASEIVPLNYMGMQPILEDLFGLIEEKYICVSFEDNALEFWWNPQKLMSELEDGKTENVPEEAICAIEGQVR